MRGARSTELRVWTRLVRLRRAAGRSPDARDELAAAYATFTEGFEEADLVAARELLAPSIDRQ
jgi:hypothetical protein